MYIVANGKIYSAVYSYAFKMYPELKLVKNAKGELLLKPTDSGVAKKPASRQLATLEEVLAQFGSSAELETATEDKAQTATEDKAKTSTEAKAKTAK